MAAALHAGQQQLRQAVTEQARQAVFGFGFAAAVGRAGAAAVAAVAVVEDLQQQLAFDMHGKGAATPAVPGAARRLLRRVAGNELAEHEAGVVARVQFALHEIGQRLLQGAQVHGQQVERAAQGCGGNGGQSRAVGWSKNSGLGHGGSVSGGGIGLAGGLLSPRRTDGSRILLNALRAEG
ncbi:hypothetical protein D3C72_1573600 [compost metagenome]